MRIKRSFQGAGLMSNDPKIQLGSEGMCHPWDLLQKLELALD